MAHARRVSSPLAPARTGRAVAGPSCQVHGHEDQLASGGAAPAPGAARPRRRPGQAHAEPAPRARLDWTVHIGHDGRPEFTPPAWIDSAERPRRNQFHRRQWTRVSTTAWGWPMSTAACRQSTVDRSRPDQQQQPVCVAVRHQGPGGVRPTVAAIEAGEVDVVWLWAW